MFFTFSLVINQILGLVLDSNDGFITCLCCLGLERNTNRKEITKKRSVTTLVVVFFSYLAVEFECLYNLQEV